MRARYWTVLVFMASAVVAQDRADLRPILERLDRLEEQNRELLSEVKSLRQQLAQQAAASATGSPAPPPGAAAETTEERVAVGERRVEELEQVKVGAAQRLPVTLSGTVLFNAFLNGRGSAGQQNPVTAAQLPGSAGAGGTLRQSVLGLHFDGPQIAGGGKVSGALFLDLFAGTGTSLNQLLRLRVATLDFAWKNTTLSFGQDKPILAPREPESLAQVGLSPLTGAGNLWLWQPQVRVEQRFAFGDNSGLRAQVGLYQTSESGAGIPSEYSATLAPSRPGIEGRVQWWGERNGRRFEIAPGFHASNTHVLGESIPSRIFSVDWLLRPVPRIDFTGQFFEGENTGVVGGLRQGVTVISYGAYKSVRAVHGQGGWAQLTLRATPRLTFNAYGGQEDDRNSDLAWDAIGKNLTYAGNVMYRFGPNVLASFEASQVRTTYLGGGTRLNPHYDLGVAYLF